MKKQEHNTTKTNFLTKFKNTKIGFKIIIIGGILALVITTIVVPIVVANSNGSSKPKPNVDNRENYTKPKPQGITDLYIPWQQAYAGKLFANAIENKYDYINDQISTTEGTHPGNRAFKLPWQLSLRFNEMSKIGIDKDEVLKNKDDDKITETLIRFLGYDFGTSETFVNVFYQLKEGSAKWYRETIKITGFGAPKILPSKDATIAEEEFKNMVLPKDFNVSSDLSSIKNNAFEYTSFVNDAKFSLAQTQVKSIPSQAFRFATLPNGFVLNRATNSIEDNAFDGARFDKEAKFSLAQTQVTSITKNAFASAKLPNGFALNRATNLIEFNAFNKAIFDKEAKFSLAPTQVKLIPQYAFFKATLPNGFALSPATNSIGIAAFKWAIFDKEAKFSLAQTQVKSIGDNAFSSVKLPNDFALNSETTWLGAFSFQWANLNPGFKIPDTVTHIGRNAFYEATIPSGYAWYDKDGNKQPIASIYHPKAGWYVEKI